MAPIIPCTTLYTLFLYDHNHHCPVLGISLFEIALSLFALERTLILRAMALLEAKSGALWANWKNLALSGLLLSDIRRRERSNSKSDFKDRTVKMVEKRIKMHPPLLWCVLCRSVPRLASPRLFLLAVDDVGVWRHKETPRQHGLLYSTPLPPPPAWRETSRTIQL